jgi:hypothetical protein
MTRESVSIPLQRQDFSVPHMVKTSQVTVQFVANEKLELFPGKKMQSEREYRTLTLSSFTSECVDLDFHFFMHLNDVVLN